MSTQKLRLVGGRDKIIWSTGIKKAYDPIHTPQLNISSQNKLLLGKYPLNFNSHEY